MSEMRKALIIAILILTLPCLSFGQIGWLYNDTGSPAGYYSGMPTNGVWTAKFSPPPMYYLPDSVIVYMYSYGSGSTQLARILIWEEDATVGGSDCTPPEACDGPGTLIYTGSNVTLTMPPSEYDWVGISLADCDDTLYGDFIVGLEIMETEALSLLSDNTNNIDCCVNFMRHGPTDWYEHYSFWLAPEGVGYNMIRVHLNDNPPAPPWPILRVSPSSVFYGHALINWVDGPEPITQLIELKNINTGIDTVTAITSTNPDFTWNGDPLPYYLMPGEFKLIDVAFQTTTPGNSVGALEITHTGENYSGPPIATIFSVDLSGIGFDGHWLENFYECGDWDPLCGPWYVQRDSCLDNQSWVLFIGGYSDQDCQIGHQYTESDSFVVDWLISSPFKNPANAGVHVTWMNDNRFNSYYGFHGLYWTAPDCSYFYFVDEIPPTAEGDFVEEGPHFINSVSDSIQIAYLYMGAYAASWFIDDIQVEAAPSNMTILYSPSTDNVSINWLDTGAPSYDISRSTTDPYSGFSVIGSTADTFFADAVGANTKSFYRVTAQYSSSPFSRDPVISNGETFTMYRMPKVETNQVAVDCAVENARIKDRASKQIKRIFRKGH